MEGRTGDGFDASPYIAWELNSVQYEEKTGFTLTNGSGRCFDGKAYFHRLGWLHSTAGKAAAKRRWHHEKGAL